MKYTVKKGGKYRASFKLSGIESLASNDLIAGKLRAAGFSHVVVTGSGGVRYAKAEWHREDATADMPSQVHQIVKDN